MKRITIPDIAKLHREKRPITALTAYDYTLARLVDEAGVDIILVGDSAANIVCGYETTVPITLSEMIYHGRCVVRGSVRSFVVIDLPFGSYAGVDQGVRSACRVMKQTGAQAVKIEGGEALAPMVARMVQAGVPVMGHLGLTPQSVHVLGGYGVRGKGVEEAEYIRRSALALAEAGCFAIVLEKVPADLAREITASSSVPTIGIGAGDGVSGQILVLHDMLGLTTGRVPGFVKPYAQLGQAVSDAVRRYVEEVQGGIFPVR